MAASRNNDLNDKIVISGISGLFPSSNSVNEFMHNLYNKVDMVTSDNPRWNLNDPSIPKHIGMVEGFDKFDAQFFKVTYPVGNVMEPMGRKLLEETYGAIFDSGTSLASLKEKKIGVFIGSSFTDSSAMIIYELGNYGNFIINGTSKAMFANRISYWIDGKGPSYNLDYSCASSTACLEVACSRIKAGDCDAAIIGGCNHCLYPNVLRNMRCAGLLCLDGKTKCFDKNADGYVRSDAVSSVFLQKGKDAKRIYAEVVHVKGEYKTKPDAAFLQLREPDDLQEFLNKFYVEAKIDPSCVEYVEAHAAAIAKADRNEIQAIGNVFAKEKVIKIGSVKSNMGNCGPASGVTALTKLCLAYHQGRLPANLHYTEPHDLPAVQDNRVQVVTENEEFNRGYTAINSFSMTGGNYHVLLKGHYKKKDPKRYQCTIPQMVLASGRQEECANKVFDMLNNQPIDLEQIALLRNIFADDILGHTVRGYVILDTNENNETVCLSKSVNRYPGVKQPVWFVYSGMGSQWGGMGADLMRIPIFADAMRKCSKVLDPKGVDLLKIITEPNNALFDDILNSFVGISAVQIGLTDILTAIGIVPDYIIGHSLGETVCGYQDNTFTAEETILCTYCRGKVSKDTSFIKGAMAAVAIGYNSMVNQCPPDIDIACHNSSDSSTISGPSESVKKFVNELTARGVFAREVACANIPYHSRYVSDAGSVLLTQLRDLIKDPKPRSKKWLSTSIPQHQWDEPLAQYSSAEYHTNNALSPVLFEETAKLIPENAIVIEIAPHGLLQAIMKRSHKNCTHISLTKRGVKDGVKFLLEAIGKMYEAGLNPKLDALYPKIDYPVSTETPLLSHFVQWEHSEDWPIRTFNKLEKITARSRKIILSVHDDEYQYLEGHVREGKNVLPESAVLVLVWETLAMYREMDYSNLSIVFENIHFLSEVVIKRDSSLKLSIMINRGDSKFEVCYDNTLIATGVINGVKMVHFQQVFEEEEKDDDIILNSEDIYRVFETRGFSYDGQFKSIHSSNIECNKARVKWTNEWVTFLDSLMQLNTLTRDCEGVSVPKFIRKLSISMVEQDIYRQNFDGDYCSAVLNHLQGITRCAGVEIDTVIFTDKPVYEKECDVLETRSFFPYYSMNRVDLNTSLHIILQIVSENADTNIIRVIATTNSQGEIIASLKEVADKMPIEVEIEINLVNGQSNEIIAKTKDTEKTNVLIIENLFGNQQTLHTIRNISEESFILTLEQSVPNIQPNLREHFTIITSLSDGKQILILLKRAHLKQETIYVKISSDNKFSWVPRVYGELKTTKRVVLISERQAYCGVLGFVHKLRRDGAKKLCAVIIDDFQAASFNPEINIYKDQIEKNLAINIMKKGQWGSYYYTLSPKFVTLRNATLTKIAPSIQDGLVWVEQAPIIANNNLVQVSFAGLSLKDLEKAVNNEKIEDTSFGLDFSGIDISGDRVMGIIKGSVSSSIEADFDLLWPVPDHWSLEEAATVPLPYVHAYYCLTMRSELCKGQTVLVTGGTGALGQAIISLCLNINCKVFTTVSTLDKKKFLLKLFPELNEHHVGYSGDDSFHSMVTIYTKNKGCDLVINSSTGSLREAAMKCVGVFGLFLDLSKYDMDNNKVIGMAYLCGVRNYRAVDLSNIFRPENNKDKKLLQKMVSEGIANGMVKPLTRVIYSPKDVARAFRLLSASNHRGRALIRMRDPIITNQGMLVSPRLTLSNKGVYIVINDNKDLGIELVDRLVKRGARKIVIHTRSRPVSGYTQTKFVTWMREDVAIKLNSENLQTEQGCIRMIKDGTKIGQIKGIFIVQNLEGLVKVNQDESNEEFSNKFSKLVMIVSNLDVITRTYCSELSHFVILSPLSQNDADEYSVAIVEKICRARNDIGYPALVLRYNGYNDSENKFIGSCDKLLPAPRSALFDAMEKSLKLKHKYVRTFNLKNTKRLDFIQKISDVVGTKFVEDANNKKTLGDLKLNNSTLTEIKAIISESYNVDYHLEKIQHMTIQSLKNLGKDDTNKNDEITSGPGVFYTHIESEKTHMLDSLPVVPMITLLNDGTENDLDPQGTYLTMIPGFEGRSDIFTSIAERLKIQAVTIPLGPDMPHDSIPKMAAEVRKTMKTKFETKSKFYLLGYSFGVNIALELAALLEKEGHEGIVYCLDSSPDALRVQINVYLGNITQAQLQNTVIEHAYYLITGFESIELKHDLDNAITWSEKVECCLAKLKGLVNYSNEYKKVILESMYQRFRLAQEYKPKIKLRSELVLIRGVQNLEQLSDDYGLGVYSEKKVSVHNLGIEYKLVPRDCRVPNIINRLLEPSLLEIFRKKNLCDTYVIEA
ncbi:fatty acid synthase [Manduca sexta]|uniref:Esterase n=1 Tax=Manduca sexta TaxID=7130 RepID=A0A921Z4N6_MANSE|nr:fatty acid synthase [Manduca sexta]XP_030025896.1 fatty acid synthase [Manduca sexta]XP_030025897.1 fatty acid synthase [Manduca sexta]KAG6451289.1 hypothetical protein O3G_MSEX007052 [Manduca sexta]KAG6451290.1 hypothetical protein O3G_MSEX007052 [Manduca sexta]UXP72053.1 esterase [Manduca sexta]